MIFGRTGAEDKTKEGPRLESKEGRGARRSDGHQKGAVRPRLPSMEQRGWEFNGADGHEAERDVVLEEFLVFLEGADRGSARF